MSEGDEEYSYHYDVDGLRTYKTGTSYFVDLNGNVISETDEENKTTVEMVYGSQALARKVNSAWYYYIYNAHGDVIGLTDTAGNVVNSYEYDAWGNVLSKTEIVENPVRYAGQYYDDELGMYYLRARYYNPQIGRFTSVDAVEGSVQNPLDMNQYVYCRNNPVMYVDYTGESVSVAVGIGTSAVEVLKYGAAILGGVVIGEAISNVVFAKKSKLSGKEKASDVPSWAKGEKPKNGESGKDFAKRLMDKKYGKGNYRTGPGTEYNKLKKYGDRGGR